MLGMQLEEPAERPQSLGYALRVVEPVHAEDHALVLGEAGAGRVTGLVLVAGIVDAERQRDRAHGPVAVLRDAASHVHLVAQQPVHAVEEIADVARHVESDQVAGQHPAQ